MSVQLQLPTGIELGNSVQIWIQNVEIAKLSIALFPIYQATRPDLDRKNNITISSRLVPDNI